MLSPMNTPVNEQHRHARRSVMQTLRLYFQPCKEEEEEVAAEEVVLVAMPPSCSSVDPPTHPPTLSADIHLSRTPAPFVLGCLFVCSCWTEASVEAVQ